MLDADREILRMASGPQCDARALPDGRYVVGELAIELPEHGEDRIGDRLAQRIGRGVEALRRELDGDPQLAIAVVGLAHLEHELAGDQRADLGLLEADDHRIGKYVCAVIRHRKMRAAKHIDEWQWPD